MLLRVDLNVPMANGRVTDATRIERGARPSPNSRTRAPKVILLAHFGRPKGGPDEANSLKPVATALTEILSGRSPSRPTASARRLTMRSPNEDWRRASAREYPLS